MLPAMIGQNLALEIVFETFLLLRLDITANLRSGAVGPQILYRSLMQ